MNYKERALPPPDGGRGENRGGGVFRGFISREAAVFSLLLSALFLLTLPGSTATVAPAQNGEILYSEWLSDGRGAPLYAEFIDDNPLDGLSSGAFVVRRGDGERFIGGVGEQWRNIAKDGVYSSVGASFNAMFSDDKAKSLLLGAANNRDIDFSDELQREFSRWRGRFSQLPLRLLEAGVSEAEKLGEGKAVDAPFVRTIDLEYQTSLGDRPWSFGINALGAFREKDNEAIAWQLRGYGGEAERIGGNAGLIYRWIKREKLLGVNAFLDFENNRHGDFWRWSLGAELRSEYLDFRANQYFALDDPKRLPSGGWAYSQSGLDAALEFHAPGKHWLSGGLTYYVWEGEKGQPDTKGLRYLLRVAPMGGNEFWDHVNFEVEYDQPQGRAGHWGGKVVYTRNFGEQSEGLVSRSRFDPRRHLFSPVLREYSQRIQTAASAAFGAGLPTRITFVNNGESVEVKGGNYTVAIVGAQDPRGTPVLDVSGSVDGEIIRRPGAPYFDVEVNGGPVTVVLDGGVMVSVFGKDDGWRSGVGGGATIVLSPDGGIVFLDNGGEIVLSGEGGPTGVESPHLTVRLDGDKTVKVDVGADGTLATVSGGTVSFDYTPGDLDKITVVVEGGEVIIRQDDGSVATVGCRSPGQRYPRAVNVGDAANIGAHTNCPGDVRIGGIGDGVVVDIIAQNSPVVVTSGVDGDTYAADDIKDVEWGDDGYPFYPDGTIINVDGGDSTIVYPDAGAPGGEMSVTLGDGTDIIIEHSPPLIDGGRDVFTVVVRDGGATGSDGDTVGCSAGSPQKMTAGNWDFVAACNLSIVVDGGVYTMNVAAGALQTEIIEVRGGLGGHSFAVLPGSSAAIEQFVWNESGEHFTLSLAIPYARQAVAPEILGDILVRVSSAEYPDLVAAATLTVRVRLVPSIFVLSAATTAATVITYADIQNPLFELSVGGGVDASRYNYRLSVSGDGANARVFEIVAARQGESVLLNQVSPITRAATYTFLAEASDGGSPPGVSLLYLTLVATDPGPIEANPPSALRRLPVNFPFSGAAAAVLTVTGISGGFAPGGYSYSIAQGDGFVVDALSGEDAGFVLRNAAARTIAEKTTVVVNVEDGHPNVGALQISATVEFFDGIRFENAVFHLTIVKGFAGDTELTLRVVGGVSPYQYSIVSTRPSTVPVNLFQISPPGGFHAVYPEIVGASRVTVNVRVQDNAGTEDTAAVVIQATSPFSFADSSAVVELTTRLPAANPVYVGGFSGAAREFSLQANDGGLDAAMFDLRASDNGEIAVHLNRPVLSPTNSVLLLKAKDYFVPPREFALTLSIAVSDPPPISVGQTPSQSVPLGFSFTGEEGDLLTVSGISGGYLSAGNYEYTLPSDSGFEVAALQNAVGFVLRNAGVRDSLGDEVVTVFADDHHGGTAAADILLTVHVVAGVSFAADFAAATVVRGFEGEILSSPAVAGGFAPYAFDIDGVLPPSDARFFEISDGGVLRAVSPYFTASPSQEFATVTVAVRGDKGSLATANVLLSVADAVSFAPSAQYSVTVTTAVIPAGFVYQGGALGDVSEYRFDVRGNSVSDGVFDFRHSPRQGFSVYLNSARPILHPTVATVLVEAADLSAPPQVSVFTLVVDVIDPDAIAVAPVSRRIFVGHSAVGEAAKVLTVTNIVGGYLSGGNYEYDMVSQNTGFALLPLDDTVGFVLQNTVQRNANEEVAVIVRIDDNHPNVAAAELLLTVEVLPAVTFVNNAAEVTIIAGYRGDIAVDLSAEGGATPYSYEIAGTAPSEVASYFAVGDDGVLQLTSPYPNNLGYNRVTLSVTVVDDNGSMDTAAVRLSVIDALFFAYTPASGVVTVTTNVYTPAALFEGMSHNGKRNYRNAVVENGIEEGKFVQHSSFVDFALYLARNKFIEDPGSIVFAVSDEDFNTPPQRHSIFITVVAIDPPPIAAAAVSRRRIFVGHSAVGEAAKVLTVTNIVGGYLSGGNYEYDMVSQNTGFALLPLDDTVGFVLQNTVQRNANEEIAVIVRIDDNHPNVAATELLLIVEVLPAVTFVNNAVEATIITGHRGDIAVDLSAEGGATPYSYEIAGVAPSEVASYFAVGDDGVLQLTSPYPNNLGYDRVTLSVTVVDDNGNRDSAVVILHVSEELFFTVTPATATLTTQAGTAAAIFRGQSHNGARDYRFDFPDGAGGAIFRAEVSAGAFAVYLNQGNTVSDPATVTVVVEDENFNTPPQTHTVHLTVEFVDPAPITAAESIQVDILVGHAFEGESGNILTVTNIAGGYLSGDNYGYSLFPSSGFEILPLDGEAGFVLRNTSAKTVAAEYPLFVSIDDEHPNVAAANMLITVQVSPRVSFSSHFARATVVDEYNGELYNSLRTTGGIEPYSYSIYGVEPVEFAQYFSMDAASGDLHVTSSFHAKFSSNPVDVTVQVQGAGGSYDIAVMIIDEAEPLFFVPTRLRVTVTSYLGLPQQLLFRGVSFNRNGGEHDFEFLGAGVDERMFSHLSFDTAYYRDIGTVEYPGDFRYPGGYPYPLPFPVPEDPHNGLGYPHPTGFFFVYLDGVTPIVSSGTVTVLIKDEDLNTPPQTRTLALTLVVVDPAPITVVPVPVQTITAGFPLSGDESRFLTVTAIAGGYLSGDNYEYEMVSQNTGFALSPLDDTVGFVLQNTVQRISNEGIVVTVRIDDNHPNVAAVDLVITVDMSIEALIFSDTQTRSAVIEEGSSALSVPLTTEGGVPPYIYAVGEVLPPAVAQYFSIVGDELRLTEDYPYGLEPDLITVIVSAADARPFFIGVQIELSVTRNLWFESGGASLLTVTTRIIPSAPLLTGRSFNGRRDYAVSVAGGADNFVFGVYDETSQTPAGTFFVSLNAQNPILQPATATLYISDADFKVPPLTATLAVTVIAVDPAPINAADSPLQQLPFGFALSGDDSAFLTVTAIGGGYLTGDNYDITLQDGAQNGVELTALPDGVGFALRNTKLRAAPAEKFSLTILIDDDHENTAPYRHLISVATVPVLRLVNPTLSAAIVEGLSADIGLSLQAIDGAPPYTYSVTAVSPPEDRQYFAVGEDGVFHVAEPYPAYPEESRRQFVTVSVAVADARGGLAAAAIIVSIAKPIALSIDNAFPQIGLNNVGAMATLSAVGGIETITYTLQSELGDALSVDSGGVISLVAARDNLREFLITASADDGAGGANAESLTVTAIIGRRILAAAIDPGAGEYAAGYNGEVGRISVSVNYNAALQITLSPTADNGYFEIIEGRRIFVSGDLSAPGTLTVSVLVVDQRFPQNTARLRLAVTLLAESPGAGGVFTEGRVYLIGGEQENGVTNEVYTSENVERWIKLSPSGAVFSPRKSHQALAHRGRMFVIGGENADGEALSDVWSSTDGARWTLVNDGSNSFPARSDHQAVVYKDTMFVIAGKNGVNYYNDVWASSDAGATWRKAGDGAFSPRAGHMVVVHNGRMFLIAGGEVGAVNNEIWESFDGARWTRVNPVGDIFPGRREHSVVSHRGSLYLRAGANDVTFHFSDTWVSADGVHWRELNENLHGSTRSHSLISRGVYMWMIGGKFYAQHYIDSVHRSETGENWFNAALPLGVRSGFSPVANAQAVVYDSGLLPVGDLYAAVRPTGRFTASVNVQGYVGNIVAGGGDGEYHYQLATRSAEYFAINTGGEIFLTNAPPAAAVLVATVTVGDSDGRTMPLSFTVDVVVPALSAKISVYYRAVNTDFQGIVASMSASGGDTNYNFSLSDVGADNFSVNAAGEISLLSRRGNVDELSAVVAVRDGQQPPNKVLLSLTLNIVGKFFIVGGRDSVEGQSHYSDEDLILNDIWNSVDGKNWFLLGALPGDPGYLGMTEHQLVNHDNKLILIGGCGGFIGGMCNRHYYNAPRISYGGSRWTEAIGHASYQLERQGHQIVKHNGKLYLIGGKNIAGNLKFFDNVLSSRDGLVWRSVWEGEKGSFAGRFDHQAVSFKGKIYVLGGEAARITSGGNIIEKYSNDIWSSINGENWRQVRASTESAASDLFSPRVHHQVVVHNDSIYVFGGVNNSGDDLGDIWKSDDGENWRQVSAGGYPTDSRNHQVVSHQGTLFLSGRQGMFYSDDNAATWRSAAGRNVVPPRIQHQMAVFEAEAGPGPLYGFIEPANLSLTISPAESGVVLATATGSGGVGGYTYEVMDAFAAISIDSAGVMSLTGSFSQSTVIAATVLVRDSQIPPRMRSMVFTLSLFVDGELSPGAERERMFLLGGFYQPATSLNDVWSSVDGKTWVEKPQVDDFIGRGFHRALTLNNSIYIIGSSRKNDVWGGPDGARWRLLKENDANSRFPAAFRAPTGFHGALHQGSLYVIGGYYVNDDRRAVPVNEVWASANGADWRWMNQRSAKNLPALAHHRVVSFNGDLLVIGGRYIGDRESAPSVWRSTDGGVNWEAADEEIPLGLKFHSTTVHNGTLFVVGGSRAARTKTNEVWYATGWNQWRQIDTGDHAPPPVAFHQLVSFDDTMFLIGGLKQVGDSHAYSDEIWSSKDGIRWKFEKRGEFSPREGHQIVVFTSG